MTTSGTQIEYVRNSGVNSKKSWGRRVNRSGIGYEKAGLGACSCPPPPQRPEAPVLKDYTTRRKEDAISRMSLSILVLRTRQRNL